MRGESKLSRREFGALLAAAPLATGSRAGERLEPQGGPSATKAGPIKTRPFPLKQVRLLSGTCYTLQDRNRVYLHTLDSARLLHTVPDQARTSAIIRQLRTRRQRKSSRT